MIPKTIKTDQKIFQISNSEGDAPYLCNLEHFNLSHKGELLGAKNESIVRVKEYWNFTFKKIGKIHVKEMILANFPQQKNKQPIYNP